MKEIEKIVADAQNDEIVNSYVTEFEIGQEFVARIVGAQGAGVNRIRDQLGVRVDFFDDHDDKDKDSSKKKKATPPQHKVKVKVGGANDQILGVLTHNIHRSLGVRKMRKKPRGVSYPRPINMCVLSLCKYFVVIERFGHRPMRHQKH